VDLADRDHFSPIPASPPPLLLLTTNSRTTPDTARGREVGVATEMPLTKADRRGAPGVRRWVTPQAATPVGGAALRSIRQRPPTVQCEERKTFGARPIGASLSGPPAAARHVERTSDRCCSSFRRVHEARRPEDHLRRELPAPRPLLLAGPPRHLRDRRAQGGWCWPKMVNVGPRPGRLGLGDLDEGTFAPSIHAT
jgi:hypothetical protein